ncbi:MAG: 23S rRNA (adenine(2030)-N(6))-methyltransferase RlmJ [Hyphomicrobiales bacterium]|nr:23S rRNA (adenine(2030)-N(6))-methyltransferase RlmJ [Hyphomicrobiales bacterium]
MNYRHVFHAGNFADVVKHAVLARILVHLAQKPQPFRVIDIHGGSGLYDLTGALANRTGEWRNGIGKLLGATLPPATRDLLAPYLDAVLARGSGGAVKFYPGSPLLALALMRPQDRLIACELEPHAATALARNLKADRRAKVIEQDGWLGLRAHLPPVERRGVVLIDPPFEAEDEFARLAKGIEDAHAKWPTGIYLVWYPVKDASAAGLARRLARAGIPKILRAEFRLAPPTGEALTACGLLVINPPWRLEGELKVILPALAEALGAQGPKPVLTERIGPT